MRPAAMLPQFAHEPRGPARREMTKLLGATLLRLYSKGATGQSAVAAAQLPPQ